MKTLVLALALTCLNVFAQGGGDHIGSGQIAVPQFELIIPSSLGQPVPTSTKISIYVNGRVVQEVSSAVRGGHPDTKVTLVGVISDMSMVNKCDTALKNEVLKDQFDPSCPQNPSRYVHHFSGNTFAEKACGQVRAVKNPCAAKMVELLDSFLKRPDFSAPVCIRVPTLTCKPGTHQVQDRSGCFSCH